MKSQSLFMEIKTAVTQFGAPLLQLFQQMFGALQAQQASLPVHVFTCSSALIPVVLWTLHCLHVSLHHVI